MRWRKWRRRSWAFCENRAVICSASYWPDEDFCVKRPLRVAVIGAGIGGVGAAGALHKLGCEVQLYERAADLGEVGAGLQIGPNGVKVLQALGLDTRGAWVAEPVDTVSLA